MFGIAGTAELSTFCPGTGTWNRLQDGIVALSLNAKRSGPKLTGRVVKLRNHVQSSPLAKPAGGRR